MKNNLTNNLFFVAAILFAFTSIIYFISGKIPMGVCFLGLAASFVSLGFGKRKKRP